MILIHPSTNEQLERFLAAPSHALALVAPTGAGKGAVADSLAAKLLDVSATKLENQPYFRRIEPAKGSISIEAARALTTFLKLKTTGEAAIRRVVIIEQAHTMTNEAQNALLKLIEEPPADTVLILTLPSLRAVLPTIASRVQAIQLGPLALAEVTAHFAASNYRETDIEKYYAVSGGLPGLIQGLLDGDTGHPVVIAVERARTLLQADMFERLIEIDDIVKQKQTNDLLYAFGQMAQAALDRAGASDGSDEPVKRWANVLEQVQRAQDMIAQNAQAKLVLTNLFLHI